MKKKINWLELSKLPANSTIFNNKKTLKQEDVDHLRILIIKEQEKIKKAEISIEAKKEALTECQDLLEFCEMRFSRVVDTSDLSITGEGETYVEPEYQEEETVKEGKVM